ncbi:MAG: glycosyltransferase family 9 protein, partial [Verrucomicrobiae bacterium]|nr:glycosyltransferase family 9 protein [Verrucomicrobiae bacterium]
VPFERRNWAAPAQLMKLWETVWWLRAQHFDMVIDLQCLARSAALGWLANGAFYIGLDEPREGARAWYDLTVRRESYYTHAVDWYLGVLEPLGVPVHSNFVWLPPRTDVAAAVRAKWPAINGKLVAVLPGARWPNKRWPASNFAALLRQLASEDKQLVFVILGSRHETQLGATLAGAAPGRSLDLTGQTSLQEMIEILRLSAVVVSNDTGPMHVAAALGRPVVALFGPTEPRRTGPYGQLENVLQTKLECVPCMRARCTYREPLACLHAITPETVAARVQQLLQRNS